MNAHFLFLQKNEKIYIFSAYVCALKHSSSIIFTSSMNDERYEEYRCKKCGKKHIRNTCHDYTGERPCPLSISTEE